MAEQFVMSARQVVNGAFIAEPGPTQDLLVPEGAVPEPDQVVQNAGVWFRKLRKAAT